MWRSINRVNRQHRYNHCCTAHFHDCHHSLNQLLEASGICTNGVCSTPPTPPRVSSGECMGPRAVVGAGLNGQELLVGWSHQDIKRSKVWPIWGSCGARRLGTRTEHNSGCRGWTSVGHKSIWSELSRAAVVLGGGGLFPLSEGLTQMGF